MGNGAATNWNKLRAAFYGGRLLPITIPNLKGDFGRTILFTAEQRKKFELSVDSGQLKKNNEPFSTKAYSSHDKVGLAAFVLSMDERIFAFNHLNKADNIAHSSFAGKFAKGAGEIKVTEGKVELILSHSGHFKPNLLNMATVITFFGSKSLLAENAMVGFITSPIPHPTGEVPSKSMCLDKLTEAAGLKRITLRVNETDEAKQTLQHIRNANREMESLKAKLRNISNGVISADPEKLARLQEELQKSIEDLENTPDFPKESWGLITGPIVEQINKLQNPDPKLLKAEIAQKIDRLNENIIEMKGWLETLNSQTIDHVYNASRLADFVRVHRDELLEIVTPASLE